MLSIILTSKASHYRRKAAAIGGFIAHARSSVDRENLLRLQRSWLARACAADWHGGTPRPPANARALAARP
jgi:hypothetical protein